MPMQLLSHGYFAALALAFVSGIGISFTPCVFPLIPITLSLFGARGENVSRGRAMFLAALYVNGMGLMYAALGVSCALVT